MARLTTINETPDETVHLSDCWKLQNTLFVYPISTKHEVAEGFKDIIVDISELNSDDVEQNTNLILIATANNYFARGHEYPNYTHQLDLGRRFVSNIRVRLAEPLRDGRKVYFVNGSDWERILFQHTSLEKFMDLMPMKSKTHLTADEQYKCWTLLDTEPDPSVSARAVSQVQHSCLGKRNKRDNEIVKYVEQNTPAVYKNVRDRTTRVEFSMAWMPTSTPTVHNVLMSQRAISRWSDETLYYIWLVTREPITFYHHRIYENVRILNAGMNKFNADLEILPYCKQVTHTAFQGLVEPQNIPAGDQVYEYAMDMRTVRSEGHAFWMDVLQKNGQPDDVRDWQPYSAHCMFGPGPRARPRNTFQGPEIEEIKIRNMLAAGEILQIEGPSKNTTEKKFFSEGNLEKEVRVAPWTRVAAYYVPLPRFESDGGLTRRLIEYDFLGFEEGLFSYDPYLRGLYDADVLTSRDNCNRLRDARLLHQNQNKTVLPCIPGQEGETETKVYIGLQEVTLHFFFFLEPQREIYDRSQPWWIGVKNLPPNVRAFGVSRHMIEDFFYDSMPLTKKIAIPEPMPSEAEIENNAANLIEVKRRNIEGITNRYYLGVVRADEVNYIKPFGNVGRHVNCNPIVVRCEHHRLADGQAQSWTKNVSGREGTRVRAIELDVKRFTEKNSHYIETDGVNYFKMAILHWWRTNSVPLFDMSKGYPADTTYKAYTYFRLADSPGRHKTSTDNLNVIKNKIDLVKRIFIGLQRETLLEVEQEMYVADFHHDFFNFYETQAPLRPHKIHELWRRTHGASCDCEFCDAQYGGNIDLARDGMARELVISGQRYDHLVGNTFELRRHLYIDAIYLGIQDAEWMNTYVPTNDAHIVQARGFFWDYYALNTSERQVYAIDHQNLCKQCWQPSCGGFYDGCAGQDYPKQCPMCGFNNLYGWFCGNQLCEWYPQNNQQ